MNKNEIDRLKEKAKNGYQMLRLPRCGTTLTMEIMSSAGMNPISLGSSSFADIPFSWGPDHHKVLAFPVHIDPDHPEFYNTLNRAREIEGFMEYSSTFGPMQFPKHLHKDWISDFNIRSDQVEHYSPNKLTFQIVRNPYDWLTSIYEWDFMGIKKPYTGFDDFINSIFDSKDDSWDRKIRSVFPWPMTDKCFFQGFNNDGECKVDVFIKFEYLMEGLEFLGNLSNEDFKLDEKVSNFDNLINLKVLHHQYCFCNECYKTQSLMRKVTKWNPNNTFNDYKHKFYEDGDSIKKVQNAYQWDLKNFHYNYSHCSTDEVAIFSNGDLE